MRQNSETKVILKHFGIRKRYNEMIDKSENTSLLRYFLASCDLIKNSLILVEIIYRLLKVRIFLS